MVIAISETYRALENVQRTTDWLLAKNNNRRERGTHDWFEVVSEIEVTHIRQMHAARYGSPL